MKKHKTITHLLSALVVLLLLFPLSSCTGEKNYYGMEVGANRDDYYLLSYKKTIRVGFIAISAMRANMMTSSWREFTVTRIKS